MLTGTLRLSDFDLGHDDRAKKHQSVASRLGLVLKGGTALNLFLFDVPTDEHRFVYKVSENTINIAQLRYHY